MNEFAIDPAVRGALIEASLRGLTVEIQVRESGCYVVVLQPAEHQPRSARPETTDRSVDLVAA